jgi:integrase
LVTTFHLCQRWLSHPREDTVPNEKLSAARVKNAKPGKGKSSVLINDSRNLYLQVTTGERGNVRRSWIFRYKLKGGRTRDMGLGPVEDVGAAEARETAGRYRGLVRQGIDPITHRNAQVAANLASASAMTFDQCAEAYIAQQRSGWTNPVHARQWSQSLADYVSPVIGKLPVAEVSTQHVLKALNAGNFWNEKPVTASRTRARIEAVLAWASASGHRSADAANPARWTNHLDKLLPPPTKLKKVKPQTALPYVEMPSFMARLQARPETSAAALQFCILTAVRSLDVREAKWTDIDIKGRVWVIPEFSKVGGEHRVPLSDAAMAVIEKARKAAKGEFVFPDDGGTMMSRSAMHSLLISMGIAGRASVHGCRASFRTFCQEKTSVPREVCEQALGHAFGSRVERSYARSDLLEKRAQLMAKWAAYLTTEPDTAGKVIELRKA